MKFCGRCKLNKELSEFHKRKVSKDGLSYYCKTCVKERNKNYWIENRDKYNESNKRWRKNNRERTNEINRMSRARHKEYENEPRRKVSRNMRHLIYYSINRKKNGLHWEDLAGYTLQDLMTHLEGKFLEGMTFDNYGKWHIDHIRPITSFNFKSFEDEGFKECWKLSNLQPLWEHDNKVKKNTWKGW